MEDIMEICFMHASIEIEIQLIATGLTMVLNV